MKVRELMDQLELKLMTNEVGLDNEISGGYVGDLLSVVMGKAKEGQVWVTILSHLNIIAVASLIDFSCIIVTEGFKVDQEAIDKANEEEIPIFETKDTSYELVKKLIKLGIE